MKQSSGEQEHHSYLKISLPCSKLYSQSVATCCAEEVDQVILVNSEHDLTLQV